MKRNIVLLFAASLFVLLLFSCSTDVSGADGSVLEQKEVAVLRTLTDTEMAALLDKELLSPAEIAAVKATIAAQADSRSPYISVFPQYIVKAPNVYNFYGWYSLNQRFDKVDTELIVGKILSNGYWQRIVKAYGSRSPAFAGSNWDAAARGVYVPAGSNGLTIAIVEGYVNGTKIVKQGHCTF